MNIIKPKKLKKGDTIGLLSVSGSIKDISRIEKAKSYFELKGYNVVISDTTYKQNRYFAGTDEERLNALHEFFNNKNINAIVGTRGGYGVIRVLGKINYNLIKANPKILVGYSDLTALLAMIYKNTGLITFHGAMANGDFGSDEVDFCTESSFFKTLQGDLLPEYTAEQGFKTYYPSKCAGVLWGGNLATINSLLGSDFIPEEDIILFLEDINEPCYKIDKMITQLLNVSGFKSRIKGIVLGKFTGVDNLEYLYELWNEIAMELKVPICDGFLISHEKSKFTIPFGARATFDSVLGRLEIIERVVC